MGTRDEPLPDEDHVTSTDDMAPLSGDAGGAAPVNGGSPPANIESDKGVDVEAFTDDDDAELVLREPNEDEVAHLTDLTFASVRAWMSLPDKFHSLARTVGIDTDSVVARPVRRALGHFLTEEDRSGRTTVELQWKTGYGLAAPTAPADRSTQFADGEATERLAGKVQHPAARALLLDLLVLRGGPGTPGRAVAAMSAYLDHVDAPSSIITVPDGDDVESTWRDRAVTLSLGRALSLAHIAQSAPTGPGTIDRAVTLAIQRVAHLLRPDLPRAIGSTVATLAYLVSNLRNLTPVQTNQVLSLLDEGIARYSDDDLTVDRMVDLIVAVDPARRDGLRRRQVQTRLDIADTREPMAAMHYLEDAARLARNFHLDELEDEAVRRMQRVSRMDHGYQTISTEGTFPGEFIDAEIRTASDGSTWQEAIAAWLGTRAPSGERATNERTARAVLAQSVFRSLATTVLVGADNMPRFRLKTDADRLMAELARTESFSMSLSGQILAAALDRIAERHGVPPMDELAIVLSAGGRGDDLRLATALARSLHRYWAGDVEGCLHTAVVRVEAGARSLVLLLDEPAYTVARTNAQGKYVGLDQLLDILASHDFDEDWDRFIRTLLLGPTGRNLRHDVAHGFIVDEPDRGTAALVLRALALFVYLLGRPSHPAPLPRTGSLPAPAWTITDAIASTAGTVLRTPAMVAPIVRAEVAAFRDNLRRAWRGAVKRWFGSSSS